MNEPRLEFLLQKELTGGLTSEERAELDAFKLETDEDRLVPVMAKVFSETPLQPVERDSAFEQQALARILSVDVLETDAAEKQSYPGRGIHILRTAWLRVAAAILLVAGTGTYIWLQKTDKKTSSSQTQTAAAKNDVLPGKDGAILTLADGRQVVLDSMGNGMIATQSGSKVNLKNGRLTYVPTREISAAIAYNTMTTPKGRQFQVALPDGTKVWLNAASSITYPTAFTGKERRVTITGEAFFEVTAGARHPFVVQVRDMEVKALGTQFNINGYEDETTMKTTLLEGKVQVSRKARSLLLTPGDQAVLGAVDLEVQKPVDPQQTVAWRQGYFQFYRDDLKTVLRQLVRWYDVNVEYAGEIPNRTFSGRIPRSLHLKTVLSILEQSNVRFTVRGNTIVVRP